MDTIEVQKQKHRAKLDQLITHFRNRDGVSGATYRMHMVNAFSTTPYVDVETLYGEDLRLISLDRYDLTHDSFTVSEHDSKIEKAISQATLKVRKANFLKNCQLYLNIISYIFTLMYLIDQIKSMVLK